MDVTHVITLAETPGVVPFAGAETHLFTLMLGQLEAGLGVEFAPLVLQDGRVLRAKFTELREAGISVHPLLVGRPYDWKLNLKLIRDFRPFFAARRHRVIHTHLDNADYIGRLSAWFAGCRRIVSSNHNNEPHYARPYWKLKLRLTDFFNGHYIAISDLIRRYLIETVGLPPRKITTVHYGAEAGALRSRAELRLALGIPAEAFVVGFVGRLEPQKNLHTLLEALVSQDSAHGVLIGTGGLDADLKSLAAGRTNIQFLGYHPQAADLIPAFDVFCLPSRWEGLGLVLIESMLRRVPIIGSTAGAIPEILGGGEFGLLFDPEKPSELAERIAYARGNPLAMTSLADKALERARNEFTVQGMVRKTSEIYRRITEKAAR
jgi:glycosyltransferase involved in cell wall biosynthesis